MNVSVATVLKAPLETVWREIRTSRLLRYVTHPLQRFVPIDPPAFPEVWAERRYRAALRSFGVIKTGWQDIVITFPSVDDPNVRQVRDNGSGQLVTRWDHLITLRGRPDGHTDYRDDIDVEAGFLTPFIATYASFFYRHRQRRLRRLVANNFDYGKWA